MTFLHQWISSIDHACTADKFQYKIKLKIHLTWLWQTPVYFGSSPFAVCLPLLENWQITFSNKIFVIPLLKTNHKLSMWKIHPVVQTVKSRYFRIHQGTLSNITGSQWNYSFRPSTNMIGFMDITDDGGWTFITHEPFLQVDSVNAVIHERE
jgi:hypothetical protein